MSANKLQVDDWVTAIKSLNCNDENQPPFSGMPTQIKSIDHPFIVVQNLDGTCFILDIRTMILKKLKRNYVASVIRGLKGKFTQFIPPSIETRKAINEWLGTDESRIEVPNSTVQTSKYICPRCSGPMKELLHEGSNDWKIECPNCGVTWDVKE